MSYIIRVFLEDQIWNLDLESFDQLTIGSGSQDTLTIRELDESQIRISRTENGEYLISGFFLAKMEDGMSSPISEDILKEDHLYRVNGGKILELTVHPRQKNSSSAVDLALFDRLQIGRNRMKNDIVLSNKRTSSVHCEIAKDGDFFVLRDLNSTNGTYLNNRLITPYKEERLYDGDVICLSIYRLYYVGGKLFFYNTGEDLQLNIRSFELSDTSGSEAVQMKRDKNEEPGLLNSTLVQSVRLFSVEENGQADSEETQVGSEHEIERMLAEERLNRAEKPEADNRDDKEATAAGADEVMNGYDDRTLIGSEEDLRPEVG